MRLRSSALVLERGFKEMIRLFTASLFSLFVIFGLGFTSPVLAQEEKAPAKAAPAKAAPAKATDGKVEIPAPVIAVINVQYILREAKASANLRDQLDAVRRDERDEIAKREDKLRDSQQELNRQRTVLSPEAFDKKRREWESEASKYDLWAKGRKQILDVAFEKSLSVIQVALVEVVRKVSADSKINLVMAKNQVLLVDNEMDITKQALDGLNKALPTVKLELGATKAKAKAKPKK